jgi:hypothetical protein
MLSLMGFEIVELSTGVYQKEVLRYIYLLVSRVVYAKSMK